MSIRITRAKAAAVAERQQQQHVDEDALLDLHSAPQDHTPLHDISPNSASQRHAALAEKEDTISEKRAKKGARNDSKNTNTLDASTTSAAPDDGSAVMPDEVEMAHSSATQAASDEPVEDVPEGECKAHLLHAPALAAPFGPHSANAGVAVEALHSTGRDIRPTTPPFDAVRLNAGTIHRSTLDVSCAGQDARDKALGVSQRTSVGRETKGNGHTQEPVQTAAVDQVTKVSPEPLISSRRETMPNVLQQTPTKFSGAFKPTHNVASLEPGDMDENGEYDRLEKAVIEASTPPKLNSNSPLIPAASTPSYNHPKSAVLSASKSSRNSVSTLPNDPIEALDAQDEAIEKISAEVPVMQDSPQKPQSKKSVPPVRLTKASQARISLAHGLPDAPSRVPSIGRPKQSMSQSSAKRVTSASSAKSDGDAVDEAPAVKKEVVIPHSKPRPMSMQFKPPPPPAKSTKAPTKSNFQLPGEAVAAKFKAAREARQQKEAEEQKKKVFKARPAPDMNKTPAVRQTSTSKARESIMNPGKPLAASANDSRPKSVATSRPATTGRPATGNAKPGPTIRHSTASKPSTARLSVAPGKAKDLAVTKRPVSMMGTSTSKARPATVLGMSSRPRPSLAPKPNPPAADSTRPTFQAGKGKEVFNRAAEAKASAQQQKREKEEAAKKARLEASERSRQLSRDWAEKQRMKKLGLKPDLTPAAAADPAATTLAHASNVAAAS